MTMEKFKSFVAANAASWLIEFAVMAVIGMITLSYVEKTNEAAQAALTQAQAIMTKVDTAVSQFAATNGRALQDATTNILYEASTVDVGGDVDVTTKIDASALLDNFLTRGKDD